MSSTTSSLPQYTVKHASAAPELTGQWAGLAWRDVPKLDLARFYFPSQHHPQTQAKLLFDDENLYVFFRVMDRYVRCVRTEYESDTHKDSCVEIFVQPFADKGYFAFEANCGGALSLRYIEDPKRTTNRFAKWTAVDAELAKQITIYHNMPQTVIPEIAEPTEWFIEMAVPFSVLEKYCGEIRPVSGKSWRANLFKCADESSMPHYASWSPVGGQLNFHQPQYFGTLVFS